MKETYEEVQDWESFLEEECPEDRTERRKAKLSHLVKRLPALMADKATNMYRQGNRSKQRFLLIMHEFYQPAKVGQFVQQIC